jgi:septum formation topological specificity factor MinE
MGYFIDRLLGRPSPQSGSASVAKARLSVIVHSESQSEFSRELEDRIKQAVYDFYKEKGLLNKIDFEEMCHELKEEGLLEVSIPLPDKD